MKKKFFNSSIKKSPLPVPACPLLLSVLGGSRPGKRPPGLPLSPMPASKDHASTTSLLDS